jgi:hypothetical protein
MGCNSKADLRAIIMIAAYVMILSAGYATSSIYIDPLKKSDLMIINQSIISAIDLALTGWSQR